MVIHRRHPLTAAAYGTGGALIADELALLIDLEDVYWAKEGRTSVDAAVGAIAVGGAYLAAAPFWHGAAREIARPPPRGDHANRGVAVQRRLRPGERECC